MLSQSSISSLTMASLVSLLCACSIGDNDVGSLERDGSATGGASGSTGATGGITGRGGATGGASGTGGVTGGGTCTYDGKTYAVGASFKNDCNTCTCGALGDTVVRCTTMACPDAVMDGGPAGTGGRTGSGGAPGTGGATPAPDAAADAPDVNEASYCAPCEDDATASALYCPPQKPVTPSDLAAICQHYLATGLPSMAVRIGECTLPTALPGCSATTPDSTVDVVSFDFFRPGGLDCQYSRATGMLVGQAVVADSPRYCGGRAYVATTSGVTNPWCTAAGNVSFSCGSNTTIDGGVDGGPSWDGAAVDGAPVASACAECGSDELCVGYYDGTCKAMYTSCNKVSAATRASILLDHARCFSAPMGDEICGTRDGMHFWGCGEPSCANEPLVSDVNCYGP